MISELVISLILLKTDGMIVFTILDTSLYIEPETSKITINAGLFIIDFSYFPEFFVIFSGICILPR